MPGTGLRLLALASLVAAGSAISCGASIRALYEGDVRFEHCMALDALPDVKPALRRACWDEWVSFYTFGQTRDRIDYATHREAQLSGGVDEGDRPRTSPDTVAAGPDPIAPPPMTMGVSDAGAPDAATPSREADAQTRCTTGCDEGFESCLVRCKRTPPCEAACAARRKRCDDRCGERRQGSR